MKKRKISTIEKTIQTIVGFKKVYNKMQQQIILRGQSQSTFKNYIHKIACISLHFGVLPEKISEKKINEYLINLARRSKSPSRSSFKHTVFGLRYYFRLLGLNSNALKLPSIKKESKLPIILNRSELKQLFKTPILLKHRIVLALVYSAGLRSQEVRNLEHSDIDFERMTIHVRQSKNKKDRILPLSKRIAKELKKYINQESPNIWLFNGKNSNVQYSSGGINYIMRDALKKSGITKKICLHSLRHSYATHLLEAGINILRIKELLGHSRIAATMVYLHVAQCPIKNIHSPLDTLYQQKHQKNLYY